MEPTPWNRTRYRLGRGGGGGGEEGEGRASADARASGEWRGYDRNDDSTPWRLLSVHFLLVYTCIPVYGSCASCDRDASRWFGGDSAVVPSGLDGQVIGD